VEWAGAGGPIACGNIVVGAPTLLANGKGSTARFRILLRVMEDGQVALLPYYALTEKERITAGNFLSVKQPMTITGPFGQTAAPLWFNLTLPGNDPLNPFKHKYHPDHDNLDRKFNPYKDDLPTYLYESFEVDRRLTLVLTTLPPGGDEQLARQVDWGGAVWGGDYLEVVENLHQNAITARGYFVIRQMLNAEQLVKQDYDLPAVNQ
jgi:hypothetical protein